MNRKVSAPHLRCDPFSFHEWGVEPKCCWTLIGRDRDAHVSGVKISIPSADGYMMVLVTSKLVAVVTTSRRVTLCNAMMVDTTRVLDCLQHSVTANLGRGPPRLMRWGSVKHAPEKVATGIEPRTSCSVVQRATTRPRRPPPNQVRMWNTETSK